MIKEQKALAEKLKNIKQGLPAQPPAKKPVEAKSAEVKPHLIILTTEDNYKVESALYYSLPIGTEQTIRYKKENLSDEVAKNLELMKIHMGYLFFKKYDGHYVPIKEIIVTNVKEDSNDIVITFMVGAVESKEVRQSHSFMRKKEDVDKLIFLALMK